jgi:hypothetical protein
MYCAILLQRLFAGTNTGLIHVFAWPSSADAAKLSEFQVGRPLAFSVDGRNVLHRVATCCTVLQHAPFCTALQRVVPCCNILQRVATCCTAAKLSKVFMSAHSSSACSMQRPRRSVQHATCKRQYALGSTHDHTQQCARQHKMDNSSRPLRPGQPRQSERFLGASHTAYRTRHTAHGIPHTAYHTRHSAHGIFALRMRRAGAALDRCASHRRTSRMCCKWSRLRTKRCWPRCRRTTRSRSGRSTLSPCSRLLLATLDGYCRAPTPLGCNTVHHVATQYTMLQHSTPCCSKAQRASARMKSNPIPSAYRSDGCDSAHACD